MPIGPLHREYLDLSKEEVDGLALGVIILDRDGLILSYNVNESKRSGLDAARVIGRNFFRDVAPCTRVEQFEGVYRKLVKADVEQSWEFGFLFKFDAGEKQVNVRLEYFPDAKRGILIITDVRAL